MPDDDVKDRRKRDKKRGKVRDDVVGIPVTEETIERMKRMAELPTRIKRMRRRLHKRAVRERYDR